MVRRKQVEWILLILVSLQCWACSSTGRDRTESSQDFVKLVKNVGQPNQQSYSDRVQNIKANIRSSDRPDPKKLVGELTKLGVSNAEVIDLGAYGKLGTSVIFIADRSLIPDFDRLYWVMVRVLSEKYGCFIRHKIDRGNVVRFGCKDKRLVVMNRNVLKNYVTFQARQYAPDGQEIIIKKQARVNMRKTSLAAK